MSTPVILEFLIDDENEDKMAAHGLTAWQVSQVLENEHVVVPNRKRRRGLYLVIGRDHGGTIISVPVEATYDPHLWHPVTAWPSKKGERALLE